MFVSINLILFVWVLTIFSACPCPVYLSVSILIGISTHLKLCLAGAIHNFKCVKTLLLNITVDKMVVNDFEIMLTSLSVRDVSHSIPHA